ncbi:MAG: dihydrofolate reductase family protein [Anaerolineales bacterium]|nr:dihydrofolate reductase family protein [Anaerolineales bacterium]
MRKLIISSQVSMDMAIDSPQNFVFDYVNDEFFTYARDQLFESDALIMGRITYEAFAKAWSERAGADEFADRMNSLSKHVASRTLKEPLTWNANLIKGDVVKEVAKLKEQNGKNILQYGSGELTHTLLEHGLIDEFRLMVFPVAMGTGQRPFENIQKVPMKLLETKTFNTGVVILHYQPVNK